MFHQTLHVLHSHTHLPIQAVGCIIELAINVAQGKLQNGFALVRPPGHHAEPTVPMGFCYFNGVAIATKVLLDRYKLKRVLIIDWDVHHGNSTQQVFIQFRCVVYARCLRYFMYVYASIPDNTQNPEI